MKKIRFLTLLVVLVIIPFASLRADDMKNIVAGPVPFNPKKDFKLNIYNPDSHTLEINIYDINGDLVCTKSGSSNPVIWNGRDESGKYVKPGLYIIKIITDDTLTGNYGKKIIRILVDY